MYSFGRDRGHSGENIVTTIRLNCELLQAKRSAKFPSRYAANCKSHNAELHARDRKTAQIKAIQMKSYPVG
jgi:hypothetical protein